MRSLTTGPCPPRFETNVVRSVSLKWRLRHPAWNVLPCCVESFRCESRGLAACPKSSRDSLQPNLPLTQPSSSLNRVCENLIRRSCTDKADFTGFPVHIDTTIGQCGGHGRTKIFVQRVMHKVIGRVNKSWKTFARKCVSHNNHRERSRIIAILLPARAAPKRQYSFIAGTLAESTAIESRVAPISDVLAIA